MNIVLNQRIIERRSNSIMEMIAHEKLNRGNQNVRYKL